MNAQLKKGVLELTVLQEISKKDLYGYELARLLGEYYTDVDISAFYTILRRLKGKEYIFCYEGKESGGPRRKYYRMTDEGRAYLNQRLEEWKHMQHIQRQLGLC